MATLVTVIMDGEFGDRMDELTGADDVWLLASATNLDALERYRRAHPDLRVTTFQESVGGPPAEELVDLLPTIALHHGEYSQQPPFDRLQVHGCKANHLVLAGLESIGFRLEGPTAYGFAAIRERLA